MGCQTNVAVGASTGFCRIFGTDWKSVPCFLLLNLFVVSVPACIVCQMQSIVKYWLIDQQAFDCNLTHILYICL